MKVHEFHTQRKNYHIIRSAYPMYRAADSPFVLQFYSFSRFCSMYVLSDHSLHLIPRISPSRAVIKLSPLRFSESCFSGVLLLQMMQLSTDLQVFLQRLHSPPFYPASGTWSRTPHAQL